MKKRSVCASWQYKGRERDQQRSGIKAPWTIDGFSILHKVNWLGAMKFQSALDEKSYFEVRGDSLVIGPDQNCSQFHKARVSLKLDLGLILGLIVV